jgi:hypothetical protein
MIAWIESQDIAVIVLLVGALCYALAAAIFAAAVLVARRRIAADLKATSPVMLTPLSVFAALVITFLAARVWSNVDHANSYVTQEANAIREAIFPADALPGSLRDAVRGGFGEYLRYVEAEEWPAMTAGHATLRTSPPGIENMLTALLSFVPGKPTEQFAQESAVVAVKHALEARQNRIMLSGVVISPVQWAVILTLDVLVLLTIAMVHIDRRVTAAVNLFTFSSAMAACLVLLMANDRPFAAGGITLEPAALREIGAALP